jgi:D-beta-D-heptose 7-phosphate kinase/D-beta-D-heptose 1-phosphate adenosyltransferase
VVRERPIDRERLEAVVDGFAERRVLVVGDVLLDEYRMGDVERVSPEAPVPVVRVRRSECVLGGAGNVARNLASLGARADLVGIVGRDPEADVARALLDELGVATDGLVEATDRPTCHKLRVVARSQQMLRLDREEEGAISPEQTRAVRDAIEAKIGGCDGVILEDYDKGLFAEGIGRWTIELARQRGVHVVADPKADLRRFRGASLLKPNFEEAMRFASGDARRSAADRDANDFDVSRGLLEKLRDELGVADLVVTRGGRGMMALEASGRAFDVPTRALEVYDVQGAGDTSIAALALARGSGASLAEACIVANAAASVVVEKVGTAAVDPEELRARLPDALAAFRAPEKN